LPIGGKVAVISRNKNAIVLQSVGEVDGKSVTVTADHRYDGFTWYDVKISSKNSFEYGHLEVVIPLKLDRDILRQSRWIVLGC